MSPFTRPLSTLKEQQHFVVTATECTIYTFINERKKRDKIYFYLFLKFFNFSCLVFLKKGTYYLYDLLAMGGKGGKGIIIYYIYYNHNYDSNYIILV